MRVIQLITVLLSMSLSMGLPAQQTEDLSYDEMIEIEEVHLGEHTEAESGSESSVPPVDPPEDLEPPE